MDKDNKSIMVSVHAVCGHACCSKIANARRIKGQMRRGGVGVVCITKLKTGPTLYIALGKNAKEGSKQDLYSICTGRAAAEDGDCYLLTAKRELKEEFKIDLDEYNFSGHEIQYCIISGTPIFLLFLPKLDVAKYCSLMTADLRDTSAPDDLKEMSEMILTPLATHNTDVSGEQILIDSFTRLVLEYVSNRESLLVTNSVVTRVSVTR